MRVLLAALIIAVATPASALVCGKRDAIVAALAAQYGEQPIGAGITANGSLIEMFVFRRRKHMDTASHRARRSLVRHCRWRGLGTSETERR